MHVHAGKQLWLPKLCATFWSSLTTQLVEVTLMVSRCAVCWAKNENPPTFWQRSTAPNIPHIKSELIQALRSKATEHENLEALTVKELRHLFRHSVRGQWHSQDPTKGLSKKSSADLKTLCQLHGLDGSTGTKGQLMIQLREHWMRQCALAGDSTTSTTFDHESDDSSLWLEVPASQRTLEEAHQRVMECQEALNKAINDFMRLATQS